MDKNRIIDELNDVILVLKSDTRKDINGFRVTICEDKWQYKDKYIDSNLLIDWDMVKNNAQS